MTRYFSARDAVGGDPGQLFAMADVLAKAADQADQIATSLRRDTEATDSAWQGAGGTAYRTKAGTQVKTMASLPAPLTKASGAYRTLAGELKAAHDRAGAAMQESVALGLGEGDLVGRPFKVASFVIANPDKGIRIGELIGEVVGARQNANEARDRFVAGMGTLRADVSAAGGDGRRNPDERGGRRIRNDEIFRRSEGGDRGGDHLDNDWAGRAILERYLRGGDDWTITDDEEWSRYMMNNQLLREQLTDPAQQVAQDALARYLSGQGETGTFDRRFHAEIENGEGIVGYQYLHGTDSEKGDFQFRGDTNVRPRPDGTYEVTLNSGYTWNDTIDPNPKYSTDTWKSRLAEVLTLGQADPYDLHITWHAQTKVILDRNGNVIEVRGYPAP